MAILTNALTVVVVAMGVLYAAYKFYGNFLDVVVSSRDQLSPADLEWITDGRVITGKKAAEVGVVDRVGDLRDAYESAKTRAQLARARLVKYHRPIEYVGSAYGGTPLAGGTQLNLLQLQLPPDVGGQPGFYYLWDPMVW